MSKDSIVRQSIRQLFGPHAARPPPKQPGHRRFLRYDELARDEDVDDRWTPIPDGSLAKLLPAPSPKAGDLVVVTWNVWFGEHERSHRTRAILSLLLSDSDSHPVDGPARPADVVCFQEVTSPFFDAVLHDPMAQRDWVVTDFDLQRPSTWYGTMILLRKSLLRSLCPDEPDTLDLATELVRYAVTKYSRTLLVARVSVRGQPVFAVGTTHLESLDDDVPFRRAQIEQGLKVLARHEGAATVWCGDTNIVKADELQPLHDAGFVDGFAQTHAQDFDGSAESSYRAHPTFNVTYPDLLPAGARTPKRIDYLLSRPGATLALRPLSSGLLGATKVPVGHGEAAAYPSDHLGVWVRYGLE